MAKANIIVLVGVLLLVLFVFLLFYKQKEKYGEVYNITNRYYNGPSPGFIPEYGYFDRTWLN